MGWLVLLAFGVLLVACSTAHSGSPRSDATDRERTSPTVPPSATPRPTPTPTALPVPAAGTYVALGDSLAVGVGAEQPDEGGYVARLFAELSALGRDGVQAARLTNVAVSGETSDSIIRDGQLARGARAIGEA
ncbi:MAG TPA: hypothetical protein VHK28_10340, partial [Candidatus Limnocylindria bacterium]|nr:hypothetical protein [Candidatus Limnocylindria bacterium]